MTYWYLLLEFAKIGLFAFGGGLAALPFLAALVGKYDWFNTEMLANMIAVSESTPGPLGVNMATYAGFHAAGIPGAILATLATITPGLIIMTLVARALTKFKSNPLVQRTFVGLRPAVAGLVCAAAFAVAKESVLHWDFFDTHAATALLSRAAAQFFDIKALILFALLMIPLSMKKLKKIHPLFYILAAGAIGVVFKF